MKGANRERFIKNLLRMRYLDQALERGASQEEIDRALQSLELDGEFPPSEKDHAVRHGRDLKRAFDPNSEVARTGYVVRRPFLGVTQELLMWSKSSEMPCAIFKQTPIEWSTFCLLLRGGRITYADVVNVDSLHYYTPSGKRLYPQEALLAATKFEDEGVINISWADVEAHHKIHGDDFSRPDVIYEAFVVGSYPEAIVICESVHSPSDVVEEMLSDFESADLPLLDKWLRPITLEGARKILTGQG